MSRWLPPAVFAALILVATSWPDLDLGRIPNQLDKLGHLLMYGVFGALVLRATSRPRSWATLVWAWVGIALFAALDEWHQEFISGRGASLGDWAADVVGALAGLVIARRLVPPTRSRPDART
ncbi:MAG: VanZ family protein [Gemmatimonadaceae bacterium]